MTLSEVLQDPERMRRVVADANHVLDAEVSDKSGLTGIAVKGAFAVVKAVKPGIIPEVIENLLPDFARVLDPIIAQKPEGTSLSAFLQSRSGEVVSALLSITDDRARKSSHKTLVGAYHKLRPQAEKHVAAAVPRISQLVDRHVGEAAKAAQQAGGPAA